MGGRRGDAGPRGGDDAADTWAAAAEMRARGVDLLLFAGGDGTARDIHDAIGDDLPLVGIPTGVKMHSGVFAATPDAAGAAAAAYLTRPGELQRADIADVDEAGRAGGPGRDAALRRGAGAQGAPAHPGREGAHRRPPTPACRHSARRCDGCPA